MSIQAFYTQTQTAAAATTAGAKPASGAKPDATMAFLDLMLANIIKAKNGVQTPQQQAPQKEEVQPLQSQNPLLDKTPSLASLIATDENVAQQVKDFIEPTLDSTGDEISQTLVLNQQAFDEILKPLVDKNLLPEETLQKLEALKTDKTKGGDIALQDILQTLLPQLQDLNANGQITITNLTPEQITEIQTQLETLKSPQDMSEDATSQAVASILQSLLTQVKITEPVKTATPGLSSTPVSAEDESIKLLKVLTETTQTPDPADLNNIDVGSTSDAESVEKPTRFEDLIESLMENKGGREQVANIAPEAQAKMTKPEIQHTLPALPSLMGMDQSNWCTFYYADDNLPQTFALNTTAVASASTLTNPVTQAQSVTQTVPGTQIIAATMQKMGADGQNRSITLQLDPPELGRVEVKMNFDKDKSIKAVLTVEKPETFHMLQRDAHALERAMSDIGLNAEGGMSFELAQDGHNFNQDGGHDGSRNKAFGGAKNSDDDIIQSTMTWQIDTASGHTRYNIWA